MEFSDKHEDQHEAPRFSKVSLMVQARKKGKANDSHTSFGAMLTQVSSNLLQIKTLIFWAAFFRMKKGAWFTKNARNRANIGFNPHSCCVNSQLSALRSPILVKVCKSNIHLINILHKQQYQTKKRYLFQWFIITN